MDGLLMQIEEALEHHLYQLALTAALCIPDTCAALEADNGRSTRERYAKWYDANMAPEYVVPVRPTHDCSFTGQDRWAFRCAVLHQSKFTPHAGSKYSRVFFADPRSTLSVHMCVFGDLYFLDVVKFCQALVGAAERWAKKNAANPTVIANREGLVRTHPRGVGPVRGAAVIG